METETASVQDIQRTLEGKFSHMEKNAEFVDKQIIKLKAALQASTDKRKDEVSECRKPVLYLEAYSRRENLRFEGIPELVEATVQQNVTSHEDTKNVLANCMENVLGIKDAKDIEFQRVHRKGKPRMDGSGGRTTIARSLRFPDRERVFKCERKLKGTNEKMFEHIPKELREAVRIFRESKISDEKSKFFLFCQNIPFCELVSKKVFLSSSDFFSG